MSAVIEWRREPDRQHTGSAELLGVPSTPYIYMHPHDKADLPRYSCAGWYIYNHKDTTESPITANKFTIICTGHMSYMRYQMYRSMYRRKSSLVKFALKMFGDYRGQEGLAEVFEAPLASSIQVSGDCAYDAFLKFDTPLIEQRNLKVIADLFVHSEGECGMGAIIGLGRITEAHATVADQTGKEHCHLKSTSVLRAPANIKEKMDHVEYGLFLPKGISETRIGGVSAGAGYGIGAGWSTFGSWARVGYTIVDETGNVILEPEEAEEE